MMMMMMMIPIGGISKKTSSSRHGSLNPFHSNIDTPVNANNGDKKGFLNNNNNDGGNNQKLILFILGNAISGAPIIKGTRKLPKPPIAIGITIKKIIKKACPVTKTLYN